MDWNEDSAECLQFSIFHAAALAITPLISATNAGHLERRAVHLREPPQRVSPRRRDFICHCANAGGAFTTSTSCYSTYRDLIVTYRGRVNFCRREYAYDECMIHVRLVAVAHPQVVPAVLGLEFDVDGVLALAVAGVEYWVGVGAFVEEGRGVYDVDCGQIELGLGPLGELEDALRVDQLRQRVVFAAARLEFTHRHELIDINQRGIFVSVMI